MSDDVQITGTEEFVRVAKALNDAGSSGRGLWKELNDGLKRAAKPMEEELRKQLDRYLPSGYVPVMRSSLVVRVSRSTRGKAAGLKLVGTAKGVTRKRHIRVIDKGTLRHPVWGNKERWVDQRVKPGFWSEPLEQARDKPATEMRRAIQNTAAKIERQA